MHHAYSNNTQVDCAYVQVIRILYSSLYVNRRFQNNSKGGVICSCIQLKSVLRIP